MIQVSRRILSGTGMLFLVALLAGPVRAQEAPTETVIFRHLSASGQLLSSRERAARNVEADMVVLEALEAEKRGRGVYAARRFEDAAALRTPEDARGLEHLTSAANAYVFAGRWNQAAKTSMAVADGNLHRGDLFEAAQWYKNSYYYYQRAGKDVRAQQAIWKACMLSFSPLLDEEQRTRLEYPISNCSSELVRLSATPRN